MKQTKECSKCHVEKLTTEFNKDKTKKDGIYSSCKKCSNELKSKYYSDNKTRLLQEQRIYYKKNRNRILKQVKKYSSTIPIEIKRANHSVWVNKNKNKIRKYSRDWQRKRRLNDIKHRIKGSVRYKVWYHLKNYSCSQKSKSTFSFLPYSVEELMIHLEKQFESWMTWDNYGKWHIDHIVPDCKFNYKSVYDKEFQECWALKNLRPLEALENIRKNRY